MPSPTQYSFTIKDKSGVPATCLVYVAYDAVTETVGALAGNIAALGGLLDAITDGVITDCRIIIDVAPDPSWKTVAVANTDTEQTGLFNFNQANSKYVQGVDVPCFKDSLIVSGRINLAATAVANWITNLTSNDGIGLSTTVFANSKFSNALESLRDAAVTFRKRRRERSKVSFETP
jgi:hypothetical protein